MGTCLANRLQTLQNSAARVLLNMSNDTLGLEAINALGLEALETRRAM
jgi:hypothetical protein